MKIKQTTNSIVTGHYRAIVRVGDVTIKLDGEFELPDSGALELSLELAIKNQIEVSVLSASADPKLEAQPSA